MEVSLGYDPAFFDGLKRLMSDPVWEMAFTRPDIEFERLQLKPSYCHANVERWIALNSGWTRMRGWLVSPFSGGLAFIAHSLAAGPDGELWDVTPYLDARARDWANRFIRHPGSDEQFDCGVSEHWGKEHYLWDPGQVADAVGEYSNSYLGPADDGERWDE